MRVLVDGKRRRRVDAVELAKRQHEAAYENGCDAAPRAAMVYQLGNRLVGKGDLTDHTTGPGRCSRLRLRLGPSAKGEEKSP